MNEKKNAFGLPRYELGDILNNKKVITTIEGTFADWFKFLGMDTCTQSGLTYVTLYSLRKESIGSGRIDEGLRDLYKKHGVFDAFREKLQGRAKAIHKYMKPYLGMNVLDFGCGPGEVGQFVKDQKPKRAVTLTDVFDAEKRTKFAPELPFRLRKPGTKLDYKTGQFDTGLLITVLHHAENPLHELDEVARVTNGNICVVESIYGVRTIDSPVEQVMKFPKLYYRFHGLSNEQQRMYGTFMDWFLNKMFIGNSVNCPYNFNSPQNWERIFQERGLKVIEKKMLGIDQPVTPEYHVFYALSNKREPPIFKSGTVGVYEPHKIDSWAMRDASVET